MNAEPSDRAAHDDPADRGLRDEASDPADRGLRTSVGAAAASGARWLTAAQIVNQLSRLLLTLVLAWYLTPAEYGLVAVATVATSFIDLLADLGTGQAVIQRQDLTRRLTDAIFALNTLIGLVLGVLLMVLAAPLSTFLGGGEASGAAGLMVVLGLNVIIKSAGVVQISLLRRRLQFRRAGLSMIASAFVYAVVSLALAIAGTGAWSIVIGTTAGSFASVVLAWYWTSYRPSWRFDLGELRSVTGFSLNLTATNIFNYATQNVDRSLIGHNFGVAALGIYGLGTRALRMPIITLTKTVNQVVMPTLAMVQNDHAVMRRRFLRSTAPVVLVAFPLMVGLTVLAGPLIRVVFPARWEDAIPIITVMAPIGMVRTVMGLVSPIYLAKGRTDLQFRWSIVFGVAVVVGYVIGAQFTLLGFVVVIAVVHVAVLPAFFWIPFRLIDLRFGPFLATVLPALGLSLVMGSAVLATRFALAAAGFGDAVIVAVCVPLGALVYVAATVLLRPPGGSELLSLLGRRFDRTRTRTVAV